MPPLDKETPGLVNMLVRMLVMVVKRLAQSTSVANCGPCERAVSRPTGVLRKGLRSRVLPKGLRKLKTGFES